MKNIILLGATGSIGDSVLSVIEQNNQKLKLFGIALNSNITKIASILDNHDPSYIYIESEASCKDFKDSNIDKTSSQILHNKNELEALINHDDVDIIVSAISGFAGLETTLMAAKSGKVILLANKESVVVAGDILLPLAQDHNTTIIPIDSEHNAIFQCLGSKKKTADVSKVVITASGGPFLNKSLSSLKKA